MAAHPENSTRLRDRVLGYLLEHVEKDPYPSATMLDMIENLLHEDSRENERYVKILMERVKDDNYPSMDLLRRLHAYAASR